MAIFGPHGHYDGQFLLLNCGPKISIHRNLNLYILQILWNENRVPNSIQIIVLVVNTQTNALTFVDLSIFTTWTNILIISWLKKCMGYIIRVPNNIRRADRYIYRTKIESQFFKDGIQRYLVNSGRWLKSTPITYRVLSNPTISIIVAINRK